MVKSSITLPLLPVISLEALINIIQDEYSRTPLSEQLLDFYFLLENNDSIDFSKFFNSPFQEIKNIGQLWINSSLGLCSCKFTVQELFNDKNIKIIQLLRKQLKTQNLKWIIVVLKDATLIFSLYFDTLLIWTSIPKNLSALFLSVILVNPTIIMTHTDDYKLNSYRKNFSVLKKLTDVIRKVTIQECDEHPPISSLQGFLSPDTFIESNSYIKKDFEQIKLRNGTHLTQTDIIQFITILKKKIPSDSLAEITSIELLDLTPSCLLEYPPFELNIDKMRGQYFTPLELAFPLVIRSFSYSRISNISSFKEFMNLKVLDPASGTGIILIVALEWLVNQFLQLGEKFPAWSIQRIRKEVFFNSISGYDIDERVVEFSKDFVKIFLELGDFVPENEWTLQNKNYLSEMANYFQNNRPHTRYDVILSNPPYIPFSGRFTRQVLSEEITRVLKEMIPVFMGKRNNLYIMFLGLALRYSSRINSGIVSFVIDRSFLDLSSYSEIRRTLIQEFTLKYMLENYKYKRAVVDLSIVIFKNSKDQNEKTVSFLGQKNLEFEPKFEPIDHFHDHPSFNFKIYRKAATRDLLNQIKKVTVNLGQISKISCGLEYGSMLKSHFLSHEQSSDMYRAVDGANGLPQSFVTFWVPGMKNSFVRYSKNFEEYLRTNNLNRSKEKNKEVLLISGEKERFTEPKIFLRQTASEFIVNYDTSGLFGLRNMHTIHNIRTPYSPYVIMGILTSTLGNWLGKELNIIRTTGTDGNRYPQIRIKDMNRFPIICLDNDTNSLDIHKIRQLEVKIKENIQIGQKISEIYNKLWKLVSLHTTESPFSSQKRLFHFCKDPKKFSFLPNSVRKDLSFILKDLQKYLDILEHNKVVCDEIVFKIYRISKDQWKKLF